MDTAITTQMRLFTVSCIWATSKHFEESKILAVAVYDFGLQGSVVIGLQASVNIS